ncbi:hypothetical protein TNCV_4406511 [Trichonephila clavipes]|nr:hypothetical protein TNCV_4406511 [Trichonephila clavipes]
MRIHDRWMQDRTTDRRGRLHPPQGTTSRENRQIVCMAVTDRSVASRTFNNTLSLKLTSSEKSYSAYDRELLAIYSAIRHFRYMLEARDFTVFTDHKPLTYVFRQKSDK